MVLATHYPIHQGRAERNIKIGAFVFAIALHLAALWWIVNFRAAPPPATDTSMTLVDLSSMTNLAAAKAAGKIPAPYRATTHPSSHHGLQSATAAVAASSHMMVPQGTLAPSGDRSAVAPSNATAATTNDGNGGGAHVKFLPPRVLRHWMGAYPNAAFRNNEQGTTKVLVTISADGVLVDARIATSSGSTALDAAAIDTVKHFVFKAGQRDGIAEQMDAYVDINWTITAAVIQRFAVSQNEDRPTNHFVRSEHDGRVPAGVPQQNTELRHGPYLDTLKENRD